MSREFELRVSWSASTDYGFRGESEWMEAGAFDSAEECEESWMQGGPISEALEQVFIASGIEWSMEVREVPDASH